MAPKNDFPLYQCPRYSKCDVNNCPLHPDYPNLSVDDGDSEKKCTMEKQVRVKIAENFPGVLRYNGMSPREFSAVHKWLELSPIEQEQRREKARNNLMSAGLMSSRVNVSNEIDAIHTPSKQAV